MPASSFQQTKQLRVTLVLSQAGSQFPGTGSNTLILTGLRMSARIQGVARYANTLDLRIFGMRAQDMNALTVLRWGPNPATLQSNSVQVEANGGNGWQLIFSGDIIEGSPDYRSMPDVSFNLLARFGYLAGISPVAALSYPNGAAAATVVQAICQSMGFAFENNGVAVQLSAGSYFPGSPWDQLNAVCQSALIDYYTVSKAKPTIVIVPRGSPLLSAQVTQLTPRSGLVGYPRINYAGIEFECLFDPSIIAAGLVQISGSDVPAANGKWSPYALLHELESVTQGGSWFSSIKAIWQPS